MSIWFVVKTLVFIISKPERGLKSSLQTFLKYLAIIVNLRNLIDRRYDRVQPETLWNIIKTVLPDLLIQLESLLPPCR
ncbi:MAG: DUF86 domain-containing protein [Oscillatoriales cyanobacterium RU_3_3]|nr:DUF86 domain-containing protein [Oscillatoriales cyanobacterium RU_3_3]NJR22059.1 DUF86 domain-containing protein [Richelia sp. CSU_2_1]